MTIIDISLSTGRSTVSWQNAFPVETTWHSHTVAGDRTTNSSWRLHAHTGTHVDAPLHHLRAGAAVEDLDLADYLGPCRVIDLEGTAGSVGVASLRAACPQAGERLLLRTANSRRGLLSSNTFTKDYVGLTADAARYLAEVGIRLVGIDFLSIEPPECVDARTHHVLLNSGVAVLEGLVLDEVPAGEYQLVFLPLKLAGAEAAPGRAVLVAGAA